MYKYCKTYKYDRDGTRSASRVPRHRRHMFFSTPDAESLHYTIHTPSIFCHFASAFVIIRGETIATFYLSIPKSLINSLSTWM